MAIRVSVITATCNDGSEFEGLIASIRAAKTPCAEWIVVDNMSVDRTESLVKEARDVIDHYIREADTGIYDAWNKGLRVCKGEYIAFLGADDRIDPSYFDLDFLGSIGDRNFLLFPTAHIRHGVIKKVVTSVQWTKPRRFPASLGFSHAGAWHHRSLFSDGGFDSSYKIAGDREFIIRNAAKLRPALARTGQPIVFFCLEGVSETCPRELVYRELIRIYGKHEKDHPTLAIERLILFAKLFIRLVTNVK